jgi:hypothetical protein
VSKRRRTELNVEEDDEVHQEQEDDMSSLLEASVGIQSFQDNTQHDNGYADNWDDGAEADDEAVIIREENLLQMVLWKTVHFALFLVKISINFSPGYSTVFFSSQCTSLLYNNFKILLQKFQNFCTMF